MSGTEEPTRVAEQSVNLKTSLIEALKKHARGKRVFQLHILRSTPKRSYALFPWASNADTTIYVEYEMLVVSEKTQVLLDGPGGADQSAQTRSEDQFVPVFSLETAIYTIPSTSSALLYVSKADTTGLLPTPAPSRVVTHAYLKHYLQNTPHNVNSLRIHVFARAQDQYLFPGSIENKSKRVLADNVLCKWWREVLGDAASEATETEPTTKPQLFYLLGGFTEGESWSVLSKPPTSIGRAALSWRYGHPYTSYRSALPVPDAEKVTINDLIPCFQDDPKARQMTEWASSPIPYAGQDGDYDEIAQDIRKLKDASSSLYELRQREIREQKEQERKNLTKDQERDIDGFWEVMGNRGECAAGHVAGFFVVAVDREASAKASAVADTIAESTDSQSNEAEGKSMAKRAIASLPHYVYTRLWSQIHNINYASMEKAADGFGKWTSDLHSASKRVGISDASYETHTHGQAETDNPVNGLSAENNKRAEPPKQINTLQVKKKKKTA